MPVVTTVTKVTGAHCALCTRCSAHQMMSFILIRWPLKPVFFSDRLDDELGDGAEEETQMTKGKKGKKKSVAPLKIKLGKVGRKRKKAGSSEEDLAADAKSDEEFELMLQVRGL